MHTLRIRQFCLLLLVAGAHCLQAGCEQRIDGGPCTYADFVGSATIRELKPHEDGAEAHGYWMIFDTKLSGDSSPPAFYRNEDHRVLVRNPGGKTETEWLAAQGIKVDGVLDIQVACITSGTCTPVIFRFPSLPNETVQD